MGSRLGARPSAWIKAQGEGFAAERFSATSFASDQAQGDELRRKSGPGGELRLEIKAQGDELRREMTAQRDELVTHMQVLHEEVLARISLLGERFPVKERKRARKA